MVYLNGEPFDTAPLISAYPANAIERTILTQMTQSGDIFRFKSEDALKFEVNLRAKTVEAAQALNRSGMDFAVFHESRCNETYWVRKDNGGFLLRDGVSPAAAIRDIFQNGRKYGTECATAMVIVFYGALLNVYGDTLFNRTFPSIYLMNWNRMDPLLQSVGIPKDVQALVIGDRGYFNNPDVNPQTPEWQGENVIVLPGGLYYGHGIGITTAENIIAALNGNRKNGAQRTAYLMDAAARPNYNELYRQYAAFTPSPQPIARRSATLNWPPFPAPRRGARSGA